MGSWPECDEGILGQSESHFGHQDLRRLVEDWRYCLHRQQSSVLYNRQEEGLASLTKLLRYSTNKSAEAKWLQELIKVHGRQVAPAELEALLLEHPAIAEVAVIGISM